MRRDWRGPSSSSTINSVRLRGPLDADGATVLKVVSKGDSEGMAKKLIATIGGFTGGRSRAVDDCAAGAPSELVGRIPTQPLVYLANSDAEYMAFGIGHHGIETGVRHRVLAVNVTEADPEPIFKKTRRAEFVEEARFPVEGQRRASRRL